MDSSIEQANLKEDISENNPTKQQLVKLINDNNWVDLKTFIISLREQNIDPNDITMYKKTLLTFTAQYGKLECIMVLAMFCDINKLDEHGNNALLVSCWKYKMALIPDHQATFIQTIKYLIMCGSECNIQECMKQSALMYMCSHQYCRSETFINDRAEIIKLLLDRGAYRFLKDDQGRTAEVIAESCNHHTLAQVLREYVPNEIPDTKGVIME